MSFTELATKIIKDSIVSTVYVDDNIIEPFEAKSEANSSFYDVSNGLYQSFKKENKSIDFYRFTKGNDLNKDYDYIFKNRDLLILDWHLDDPSSLRQPLTMQLLQKAIATDNLHFVSIYTQSEAKDFNDIFYSIKAYFETDYNENILSACDTAFQEIEEKIDINSIEFFNSLSAEFKLIAIDPLNSDEVYEKLKETIQAKLGAAYQNFAKFIKGISPNKDLKRGCEIFGYCINKEDFGLVEPSDNSLNYKFIGDSFIVINHTIIQITNKEAPSPIDHFNFFTKALLNVCGNLLTLSSLEIRNLLRESSGFIGKDFDEIGEEALFHHYDLKTKKGESFFDFIVEIQKSHVSSTLNHKIGLLKSLDSTVWEEYRNSNSIDKKIEALAKDSGLFSREVARLNIHYNKLHIIKKSNSKIRFGEVFIGVNEAGKPNGTFWLNITAHCDGERPKDKIKNSFFFIQGNAKPNGIEDILKNSESRFVSFLQLENDIKAIQWNEGLIILKIDNNILDNYFLKGSDGVGTNYSLKYVATLKENYAQRMANNSFSFAMRVGIDFASI